MAAAKALGTQLHAQGAVLVYGGGTTGLMGEVARTLVSLSGPFAVQGVIPTALMKQEQRPDEKYETLAMIHEGKEYNVPDPKIYGSTTIVNNMHDRKREMGERVFRGGPGSGFIALSGGFGTMEELFEVTTWNQVGIHDRPVIAYNVNGYFDGLIFRINDAITAGFILEKQRNILVEAKSAEECRHILKNYKVSDGRLDLVWGEE